MQVGQGRVRRHQGYWPVSFTLIAAPVLVPVTPFPPPPCTYWCTALMLRDATSSTVGVTVTVRVLADITYVVRDYVRVCHAAFTRVRGLPQRRRVHFPARQGDIASSPRTDMNDTAVVYRIMHVFVCAVRMTLSLNPFQTALIQTSTLGR